MKNIEKVFWPEICYAKRKFDLIFSVFRLKAYRAKAAVRN